MVKKSKTKRVFPENILPVELWSLIIKELSDIKDICNLLLTCKLFNNMVYKYIDTVYSLKGIKIEYIEKLFKFKNLNHITRITNVERKDLDKLTSMKLSEINIHMTKKHGYKLFLKQNEQLKYFSILTLKNHIISLHRNILVAPSLNNDMILFLNDLNNPNVKMIYFDKYMNNIDNLDTTKYKILLNRHQFYNSIIINYILRKPATIGFNFCAHTIDQYGLQCFVPHKIEYIYDSGSTLEFEEMLKNVKYNFPNADISGIIFNRTKYLKDCQKMMKYASEDYDRNKKGYLEYKTKYENEIIYSLIDKPYKII